MKEGWICPRCGKVNAPFIRQCICESDNSTTSNFDANCIHYWVLDSINSDPCGVMYKYHCIKCGKSIRTESPMASIKL